MAKFGEGDPRWLVQDRVDGTNVNGWHWVEKDMMEWSKARLNELFTGLKLVDAGGSTITCTGVDSCTGEAIINNRKQKIIPSYELEIKLGWEGATADGATAKGKVHLPYVADENHDEDPEMRLVCEVDDAPSKTLKEAFQGPGKKVVTATIAKFVAELRAGGGAGGAAAAGSAPAAAAGAAKPKLSSANPEEVRSTATAAAGSSSGAAASKPAGAKAGKGGKTLNMTENFYCRASDLFECFTVEGRVRAFTQSQASVEPKVGGRFTWFGGSVQGEFTELEAGRRLCFNWRFSSWAEGCVSAVVMDLAEPEPGHTVLTLTHTGIPSADQFGNEDTFENTEKGWRTQIFLRIRQVFGYGLGL